MNIKALVMEALGVFALCYIGGLSCASPHALAVSSMGPNAALAHMLALGIMIYIGAHTSGAHYNPAVTITMACTKRIDGWTMLWYIIAQFIGGFLGGFMVWATGTNSQQFLYSKTYPSFNKHNFDTVLKAMFAEYFGTFFLVFMVFATAVDKRHKIPSVYGIAIGGTVGFSALGLGSLSGAALNPMRWLGPFLVGLWANKNGEADAHSPWGWLAYIVMTCLGGMSAGFLYHYVFLDA